MDWLWVVVAVVRGVSPAADDRWATTLAALDDARAHAFATAAPGRLDDVYVAGSGALAADRATIRDYAARGGRVVGADLRVLSCRVVTSTATRVRLDVVDRLGPARIVWADRTATPLPRDEPSRRTVTLVRTSEGWRVAGAVSPHR